MTITYHTRMTEEEVLSRLLYRDGLILVINKPSGIPVHAAGPKLHNIEQYFDHLRFGLPNAPHLAHRLDRGTSGCLVLARNKRGAQMMQELFTHAQIKKTYIAVVHGVMTDKRGRIDVPLMKASQEKSNWRMKADPNGSLSALTEYEVLHCGDDWSLVKLTPHTGRTHQLRVHCQFLGHPILGDEVYGPKTDIHLPLHLHALSMEIPLYRKKMPITVTASLPEHMSGFAKDIAC